MSIDILIVDDEEDIREMVSDLLQDHGYNPRVAKNSDEALTEIDDRKPHAVILDIWLQNSKLDGIGILKVIKRKYPHMPIIVISGHGNIETAITAVKLGAYDYIEKPFKEDKLLLLLDRAMETTKLREENEQLKTRNQDEYQFIGQSLVMKQLNTIIEKVALTSSRVLITGPAGCGKGIVARAIHQKSKRCDHPFIVLNASSISLHHFDNELFGHEDHLGSSHQEKKTGLLERAHGGTFFIEEVSDLPLPIQAKILRILQGETFERVGGNKKIHVDIRVIASSNKNLQTEIAQGKFREDLYYRLNVVPIIVPSLQEHKEDINLLAHYFMEKCSRDLGVPPRPLSQEAIANMELYSWPGNVRQLRNIIEWLLIMAPEHTEKKIITAEMLPPEITNSSAVPSLQKHHTDILGLPLKAAREVFEKEYLAAQLQRFDGNVSKTAHIIGMERSAFHRKLKLLNIIPHNTESE